nr:C2H2-type zinc finger protein [Endozoicomonas sp.]
MIKVPGQVRGGAFFANYGIRKKAAKEHGLLEFTANTRVETILYNGDARAVLFTTRDILPGSQILIPQRGMALNEAVIKGEAISEEEVIQNIKKMYKFCSHCHYYSPHTSSLNRHTKTQHSSIKNIRCELCKETFVTKEQLHSHSLYHKSVKKFRCPHCNTGFNAKKTLSRHIKLVHFGKKEFECTACKKCFKSGENLRSHYSSVHTGKDQYKFECEFCNKKFAKDCNLKSHLHVHSNSRNELCRYCKKAFKTKQLKNKHEAIHDKKLECSDCNKKFAHATELRRHSYFHTTVKHYTCELCTKSYKYHSGLYLHKKVKHPVIAEDRTSSEPGKSENRRKVRIPPKNKEQVKTMILEGESQVNVMKATGASKSTYFRLKKMVLS